MSTETAFLADIAEHPDDDTPRLVYADWLDDHGDSGRAEFIRLQCRLARLDEDDPARLSLEDRADDLCRANGARWRGQLPALADVSYWGQFRRGFIEDLTVYRARGLIAGGADLHRLLPLRQLTIQRLDSGDVAGLCALPLLDNLETLLVQGGRPSADAVKRLAGCERLRRLRRLSLNNLSLGDRGVRALARSAHLPRLEHLGLYFNDIGAASVQAILNAPGWPELSSLDLGCNEDFDEWAFDLAGSPRAARLRHLGLQSLILTPEALAALVKSPHLTALESLDLCGNEVGEEEARALLAGSALAGLRELNLGGNSGNTEALAVLARSLLLARLETIDFSETRCGTEGMRALTTGPWRPRRLFLAQCDLDDEAVAVLAGSPVLSAVRELDLWDNQIGSAGLAALAGSPHAAHLVSLEIQGPIDAAGARALVASPHLKRLRDLSLPYTELGDEGARVLAEGLDNLPGLRELNLIGGSIGDEGARALALSAAVARLRFLGLDENEEISEPVQELLTERLGQRVSL
jgi:uncharacterized protein (TIGR02996 family)